MTTQFTTPCYVRVEDATKRKEICAKLQEMGYKSLQLEQDGYGERIVACKNGAYCRFNTGAVRIFRKYIDCGTDTELFLALAGMREDTDYMQWFIFNWDVIEGIYDENGRDTGGRIKVHSEGDMYLSFQSEIMSGVVRRATAEEIINHYKQKGE